jgi:uncharacterized integral membrane protein
MIKDKRLWIAIKAGFILLIMFFFLVDKTPDKVRLFLRFSMLVFFTISLVTDINNLKNME